MVRFGLLLHMVTQHGTGHITCQRTGGYLLGLIDPAPALSHQPTSSPYVPYTCLWQKFECGSSKLPLGQLPRGKSATSATSRKPHTESKSYL
ncbi:hypothetical protein GGR53DRAFT_474411 [Hypoxylon sp. FL1150]|nr:hypothetical protein GGR53DRAFT_474411 [Hypoxylon sp. FL1150]